MHIPGLFKSQNSKVTQAKFGISSYSISNKTGLPPIVCAFSIGQRKSLGHWAKTCGRQCGRKVIKNQVFSVEI